MFDIHLLRMYVYFSAYVCVLFYELEHLDPGPTDSAKYVLTVIIKKTMLVFYFNSLEIV